MGRWSSLNKSVQRRDRSSLKTVLESLGQKVSVLLIAEHMFFGRERILNATSDSDRQLNWKPDPPSRVPRKWLLSKCSKQFRTSLWLSVFWIHRCTNFYLKIHRKSKALADKLHKSPEKLTHTLNSCKKAMLGHRGCRLGITQPEIYIKKVEAVFKSAIESWVRKDWPSSQEIMIPLIADKAKLDSVKPFSPNISTTSSLDSKVWNLSLMKWHHDWTSACLSGLQTNTAQEADFFSFWC